MRLLASRGARFDIVFSDPPYALEGEPLTVVTHLLAPGALLILQRDRNASTSPIEGLARVGDRAYGRNAFEFFERR
jgi:16S rRNA G966 N2-methylase RsmD